MSRSVVGRQVVTVVGGRRQEEEEQKEEEEERQVVGAASTCNLATGNAACQTWVAQPALSLFFLGVYINILNCTEIQHNV